MTRSAQPPVATSFDDAFWDAYGLTPDYQERAEAVLDMLPGGRSLLDVGCGRGEVVAAVVERGAYTRVAAADPSIPGLRRVRAPRAAAMLPDLPFSARAFDSVLCLQVLEHLDDDAFTASLRELRRVADQHILIGVPHRENLDAKQVRCASCQRWSHADGHLRSFEPSDLEGLFDDFALECTRGVGVLRRRQSGLAVRLGRALGHLHPAPPSFVCPHCGGCAADAPQGLRRWTATAAALTSSALDQMHPAEPYWMLALYLRRE